MSDLEISPLPPDPDGAPVVGGALLGAAVGPAPAPGRQRGSVGRFARRPAGVVALAFILIVLVLSLLAPWIAPASPTKISAALLAGPSSEHLLGTDEIGRDVLSRLLFATRASLAAAALAVGLAVAVGSLIGVVSGHVGGRTDAVLMRIMDGVLSIPGLLVAMAIVAVLGPNLRNAMIGLSIMLMPTFARLIRAQAMAVREEPFVEAARMAGLSEPRLVWRHIVPNVRAPVIVQAMVAMSIALIAEGALSFLGLSVQPPEASLGSMLQRGFTVINQTQGLILVPGLMIMALALAFNVLGDALRDVLGRTGGAS